MATINDLSKLGLGRGVTGFAPKRSDRVLIDVKSEHLVDPDLEKPGHSKVFLPKDVFPSADNFVVWSVSPDKLLPMVAKLLLAWKKMVSIRVSLDEKETIVLSAIKCGCKKASDISDMVGWPSDQVMTVLTALKNKHYKPDDKTSIPVVEEKRGILSTRF